MDFLDQTIDEGTADFILAKLDEAIAETKQQAAKAVRGVNEGFKAKQERLFAYADKLVEEAEQKVKEEYSARLIAKLQEKNEYIEQLEEAQETFKEQLTERVQAFLANSKQETRQLVEEELRLDSDTLKAQRTLDEIKAIVGATPAYTVESVDEGKIARLEEDVAVLKERLKGRDEAIKRLKAKVKVDEMLDGVPAADRDFYKSQLKGVESIEEAEATFSRIKKAVRQSRVQMIEEELEEPVTRGRIVEDDGETSLSIPRDDGRNMLDARMRQLAGL